MELGTKFYLIVGAAIWITLGALMFTGCAAPVDPLAPTPAVIRNLTAAEVPTFTPAGGEVFNNNSGLDVTLSSATVGAAIYYTTDGTDPDETKTQYTVPIHLASTTTIRARTLGDSFVFSDIVTATFILNVLPTITAESARGELVQGIACILTIQGDATDSDGSIASVLADLSALNTSDSQPLTLQAGNTWSWFGPVTSLISGRQTMTLTVTDNHGGVTTAPVDVTVKPAYQIASRASDSVEADKESRAARNCISDDGRYVVFSSEASNLVPGDTNNVMDVFLRDLQTGQITRISLDQNGNQSARDSRDAAISGDGDVIAFVSYGNLLPADADILADVYVYNRRTNQLALAGVATDGTKSNGQCCLPSISADGRYVAFESNASNLVPGDTNFMWDIFVRDLQAGQTTRVSVNTDGTEGNDTSQDSYISPDGRYVVFVGRATNLVAGDTNAVKDIFMHDRLWAHTVRISQRSDGTQADADCDYPMISRDAGCVVFHSTATTLVDNDTNGQRDIFIFDGTTRGLTRVTGLAGAEPNSWSSHPSLSADGRYVAFRSNATNLIANNGPAAADLFRYDRRTAATLVVNRLPNGDSSNHPCFFPVLSATGRYLLFQSAATNYLPGQTLLVNNLYIRDLGPP
jgi:Tol biopolymer transport system component